MVLWHKTSWLSWLFVARHMRSLWSWSEGTGGAEYLVVLRFKVAVGFTFLQLVDKRGIFVYAGSLESYGDVYMVGRFNQEPCIPARCRGLEELQREATSALPVTASWWGKSQLKHCNSTRREVCLSRVVMNNRYMLAFLFFAGWSFGVELLEYLVLPLRSPLVAEEVRFLIFSEAWACEWVLLSFLICFWYR